MKDSDFGAVAPVPIGDRAWALRAVQTEVERQLWQRLLHRQLNAAEFRRQHSIGFHIADFFCLDGRRVIELDGTQHGEDRERRADNCGTEYLEKQGYRILRFWNEEVLENIDGVLATIIKHFRT
jgi:very-short-patch-repair endonuclease